MVRPFGRILLLTGNAEFLTDRTRRRAIASVHEYEPECQVTEVDARDLGSGDLAVEMSPSLFSHASAVVLNSVQEISDDAQAELAGFAAGPNPDVALIVIHDGGNKGQSVLTKLRACESVSEVNNKAPAYARDYISWVRTEFTDAGRRIDNDAAEALVQAIGQDLRALAGAADQLVLSTHGQIDLATVRQYFGGRADVRGYQIADAAVGGRIDIALEELRWAQTNNVADVLVLSAIASSLRSLAALATAPEGMRDADLAKHTGVPPFKLRTLRDQLRSWSRDALTQAIASAARADIEIKGGGSDPSFALERLVLQIAAARSKT